MINNLLFNRVTQLFILLIFIINLMSCKNDDLSEFIFNDDNNRTICYQLSSEDLGEWNEGYVLPGEILFLEQQDTITFEHTLYINYLNNPINSCLIITADENGTIQSIVTNDISFYLSYEGETISTTSITKNGDIEIDKKEKASNNKKNSLNTNNEEQNTNSKILSNLQDWLNYYADKLAASDIPYLRKIAEDLRNLPQSILREGFVKALSYLLGKRIPLLSQILQYLEDSNNQALAFGNCNVRLSGLTEEDDAYVVRGSLEKINELPHYDDLETALTYGVLIRNAGSGTDMTPPTVYWYNNKFTWQTSYQSVTSISFSKILKDLPFGWNVFRTFEERFGIVKYCDYGRYFNPKMKDKPTFSFSNVKCEYMGNDNVRLVFTCNMQPVGHDLLYQGITLSTKDGKEIAQLGGVGLNGGPKYDPVNVDIVINKNLFDIDYCNYVARLQINAKFWFVPQAYGKTFFEELEPKSIVYEEKPTIIIKDIIFTNTTSGSFGDEGQYDTKSDYTVSYNLKGSLFFDELFYSSFNTSWNHQFNQHIKEFKDGDGTIDSSILYNWGVNYNSTYMSLLATIKDGTLYPSNYIKFLGNASATLVGTMNSQSNMLSTMKGKHIISPSHGDVFD